MQNQQHQEVLDLYHTLGIGDVENVKTTFSSSKLNGWFFSELSSDDQLIENQNDYSSSAKH